MMMNLMEKSVVFAEKIASDRIEACSIYRAWFDEKESCFPMEGRLRNQV